MSDLILAPPVDAVTLDFFNTLVFHRDGRGRGKVLMQYLERQGLTPAPWEHDVLYDVFAPHASAYSPTASPREKRTYWGDLAARVFERMGVRASPAHAAEHAEPLWEILGPSCFEVFDDALEALEALRVLGMPLAVVSNWQCGLSHFCHELGLVDYFDHILSSAEVGAEKPDPAIFAAACERLGARPEHTLHVGDTYADDYVGAESAGLQVVLIDRAEQSASSVRTIRALTDVLDLVSTSSSG